MTDLFLFGWTFSPGASLESVKKRTVITEADVRNAIRQGITELEIAEGSLITPLASDTARQKGVSFRYKGSAIVVASTELGKRIAIGADHRGFLMKKRIKDHLLGRRDTVIDVGCDSEMPCDYPSFAFAVASLVKSGKTDCGIMIDGAGIGSAIVANKVSGVRAANCHDILMARNAREHNNATVLTLGSMMIGEQLALNIIDTFLETAFAGDRHQRCLDMISDIERGWKESG